MQIRWLRTGRYSVPRLLHQGLTCAAPKPRRLPARRTTGTTSPSAQTAEMAGDRRPVRAVHRRAVRRAEVGASTSQTINPATEETLAEVAEAGAEDVDLRRHRRPAAPSDVWERMAGSERAKYLFRIARMLQERSREFAVLETMDGGKPIKEARDVDLPLVAAHFFYYAGWADKLEYAFPGRGAGAARRGRAGDPVELPDDDARLEGGARTGRRQHRGAQAGGDDPADRACSSPSSPARPGCRRGAQHRHRRRGAPGRPWSSIPTSTRWPSPARPRSARRSSARWPGRARSSPWSWAARRPTSSSTTPRSTRRSRV